MADWLGRLPVVGRLLGWIGWIRSPPRRLDGEAHTAGVAVEAIRVELEANAAIVDRAKAGYAAPEMLATLRTHAWDAYRGDLMRSRDRDQRLWGYLTDTYEGQDGLKWSRTHGGHPKRSGDELRTLADALSESFGD